MAKGANGANGAKGETGNARAKSFGEALVKGNPVVMTWKKGIKRVPQVICRYGKEKEALELMADMKLIELVRPVKGN